MIKSGVSQNYQTAKAKGLRNLNHRLRKQAI